MTKILGALLATFAFAVPAIAQEMPGHVEGAEIVDYGIYMPSEIVKRNQAPGTTAGTTTNSKESILEEMTTTVPARPDTRFGFRYKILGEPQGTEVELKMVLRYPKAGLRNPDTKETHFRDEVLRNVTIGGVNYFGNRLGKPWQLVPGTWTFEIWSGEKKIAEKSFTLVEPSQP